MTSWPELLTSMNDERHSIKTTVLHIFSQNHFKILSFKVALCWRDGLLFSAITLIMMSLATGMQWADCESCTKVGGARVAETWSPLPMSASVTLLVIQFLLAFACGTFFWIHSFRSPNAGLLHDSTARPSPSPMPFAIEDANYVFGIPDVMCFIVCFVLFLILFSISCVISQRAAKQQGWGDNKNISNHNSEGDAHHVTFFSSNKGWKPFQSTVGMCHNVSSSLASQDIGFGLLLSKCSLPCTGESVGTNNHSRHWDVCSSKGRHTREGDQFWRIKSATASKTVTTCFIGAISKEQKWHPLNSTSHSVGRIFPPKIVYQVGVMLQENKAGRWNNDQCFAILGSHCYARVAHTHQQWAGYCWNTKITNSNASPRSSANNG